MHNQLLTTYSCILQFYPLMSPTLNEVCVSDIRIYSYGCKKTCSISKSQDRRITSNEASTSGLCLGNYQTYISS